jgi:glycine hydroxymethyltransferase
VPNDPRSPFVTSGIRIGTPAVTRRGFDSGEVEQLTHWICDLLDDLGNDETCQRIRQQVSEICARHPVYG